jgi:hypothetical protein
MEDDMDPVMVKYFNDPIIVDEWSGETNSYPILIIGTQSMGGYIDKGKWAAHRGWQPAEGADIETKSNELKDVFNTKLVSMGFEEISSLNGNVAVCNVFDKQLVKIPLNINPEDYKCDQPFGDTTSGEEKSDVILSKIINNYKWIYDKLIIEGKHVFIHCNAGASRSPTVVVKMLTDTLEKSVDQAIEIVKQHAPKMDDGNDRVKIGNFKDLLLGEAGASRAVVDLEPEPDMGGFGAAQATQQDSKEEEINKIIEKIGQKNLTIERLKSEGLDVSIIEKEIYDLNTILYQLMELHAGGGKKKNKKSKKRKSKKRKSKKRKTKRKYKRR